MLGFRLEEYSKGGFMVRNDSESSLVMDVKSKQHFDTLWIELKESVLRKINESFSKGRMGYLDTKEGYVLRMLKV